MNFSKNLTIFRGPQTEGLGEEVVNKKNSQWIWLVRADTK